MEEALQTTFYRRSTRIATTLVLFLCGIAMPQFFWELIKNISPVLYYISGLLFLITALWFGKKFLLHAVSPWVLLAAAFFFLGLWRSSLALEFFATLPERLPKSHNKTAIEHTWITRPITYFEEMTNRVIPQPAASFTNGILLGRDEQIPRAHIQAFRKTGTGHIFALSGFNITIIATVVAGLLAWVRISVRARFIACIALIGAFILSTGAQSSSVRAGIMGMLTLLGRTTGRITRIRILLPLAASCMVALDPLILRYDRGFQLSFLAAFGILLLGRELKERLWFLPETAAIRETAAATIAATLMTSPLLIAIGNQVGIVSIAANIIVGPLIPLAMLLGFTGTIIGTILPPIAFIVGPIAAVPARLIIGAAMILSRV